MTPHNSAKRRSQPQVGSNLRKQSSSILRDTSGDYALLAAYLAAITFVAGIFTPCFTMIPKLGDGIMEEVARNFLSDDLRPQRFSLAGGMLHLFQSGDLLIASLIRLFTILFPLAKLAVLFTIIHAQAATVPKLLAILAHLGKWSMLDVFVIALIVISFKNFPGGSRVEIHSGLYIFATSVLLSMLAAMLLKKHFAGI